MATHFIILAQEIQWTEEPDCYSPWGRKELDTTEGLNNKQKNVFLCQDHLVSLRFSKYRKAWI